MFTKQKRSGWRGVTMTRKKILHFNFDERFSEDSPFLMKNPKVTNKLLKVKRKWINKCYVIFEVDAKNKVALQTFQTDQKLSRLTLNFPDFGNFAVSLCVCLQKSRKDIICLKFVLHFLILNRIGSRYPPSPVHNAAHKPSLYLPCALLLLFLVMSNIQISRSRKPLPPLLYISGPLPFASWSPLCLCKLIWREAPTPHFGRFFKI